MLYRFAGAGRLEAWPSVPPQGVPRALRLTVRQVLLGIAAISGSPDER